MWMNESTRDEWLAEELERLRVRIRSLENGLQDAIVPAFQRIRSLVAGEPEVGSELRNELVRGLAELKYQHQGLSDEQSNWFQSEKEVNYILKRLGKVRD
jgi:hypothetical protein